MSRSLDGFLCKEMHLILLDAEIFSVQGKQGRLKEGCVLSISCSRHASHAPLSEYGFDYSMIVASISHDACLCCFITQRSGSHAVILKYWRVCLSACFAFVSVLWVLLYNFDEKFINFGLVKLKHLRQVGRCELLPYVISCQRNIS